MVPSLAADRQRMRDMSEKNPMARRNINLADKHADTLVQSRAEFLKASQSEHRAPLNPDRQTPGSQYSKHRKKKAVKDKNVGSATGQSSNSKDVYEGGSNEKNRLNKFEQQFISNCHKTPQPNSSSHLQGELTGTTLPQFVGQSSDFPSHEQVHLPEIEQHLLN